MREFSFTEARQHFASILDEAKKEGVVCVKKRDGREIASSKIMFYKCLII